MLKASNKANLPPTEYDKNRKIVLKILKKKTNPVNREGE
jgi:hypothetical protein